MKRRWLVLLLTGMLLTARAALCEIYALDEADALLDAAGNWRVVTPETAGDAQRESLLAAGALCEIYAPAGQVTVRALPAQGAPTPYVFETQALSQPGLTLYLHSASAVRGAWQYRLETVSGQAQDAALDALLQEAARRLVWLGGTAAAHPAARAPEPPVLPAREQTETAQLRVRRDDTPLALDPVPAQTGCAYLTITGATDPNAAMRYYLNGAGQTRFEADAQGRFTLEVRLENGRNSLTVQSVGESGGYGYVDFSVTLNREQTPLALSYLAETAEESAVLLGVTLPGAQVALAGEALAVDETGAFSAVLPLSQEGENGFTLEASARGYRARTERVAVTRAQGPETVTPDALGGEAAAYAGKTVLLTGTVSRLANLSDGTPCLLLTHNGQSVLCLTDGLAGVLPGDTLSLPCALSGETAQLPDLPDGALRTYPLARAASDD